MTTPRPAPTARAITPAATGTAHAGRRREDRGAGGEATGGTTAPTSVGSRDRGSGANPAGGPEATSDHFCSGNCSVMSTPVVGPCNLLLSSCCEQTVRARTNPGDGAAVRL